ncbi:unnamed protein product [Lepeophtheirus salmonis]|uniref:(salmon louse) hypothetical protein n=1 Tax=Lepeophtheirus salmonis TaxID=72036 RepID=A0A7R8HBW3_LEPSM|nr:unnamed protein product [Lepeophtheirus salmonis]CAF2996394.1 unnamed protein product [Lepeophtheirus salmonis]
MSQSRILRVLIKCKISPIALEITADICWDGEVHRNSDFQVALFSYTLELPHPRCLPYTNINELPLVLGGDETLPMKPNLLRSYHSGRTFHNPVIYQRNHVGEVETTDLSLTGRLMKHSFSLSSGEEKMDRCKSEVAYRCQHKRGSRPRSVQGETAVYLTHETSFREAKVEILNGITFWKKFEIVKFVPSCLLRKVTAERSLQWGNVFHIMNESEIKYSELHCKWKNMFDGTIVKFEGEFTFKLASDAKADNYHPDLFPEVFFLNQKKDLDPMELDGIIRASPETTE